MRGADSRGGFYARNRVLIWICALIAINQLGFGSIVPVIPLYARSFGVSNSAIGLTIAIYGLARFLINMPAGQLADRVGRRGALAIGGLVTSLGNLLCALSPSFLPFLAARFVAGAGAALVLTASQVVMADISTPARRGRMMAVYSGVFAFAVGAGPYPGGLLAEHYGLAAPFYAFTVLGTLAAAVAWLRVPETKGLRLDRGAGAAAPPSGAQSRQVSRDGPEDGEREPDALRFGAQLRLLLAQTGFLLISVVSFSSFFARTGALFNLIPVLGKERLGLAPDQIGFGLGLISVLGLGLAYPSGMLVDRFGRKGVIVPATLISGLALLLFSRASSYSWFLCGCAAWAVASGLSSAAPAAYAADMAPPGMNAAAMSTYRMLSDSGYVVGPLLLGFAADTVGVDAALVGAATLLAATSLLFARFAPETLRGRGRAQPALAVQPPAAEPAIVVAAPQPRRDD